MIKIIPFKKEHAEFIAQSKMNRPLMNVKERFWKSLKELETKDTSWTAIDEYQNIIAAGGMVEIWDQVYEGWVMATANIEKHKIVIPKHIKKIFDEVMPRYNVQRLQTSVEENYAVGHRFAQWLGLKQEGLMKKYINGQNHYRYARIY